MHIIHELIDQRKLGPIRAVFLFKEEREDLCIIFILCINVSLAIFNGLGIVRGTNSLCGSSDDDDYYYDKIIIELTLL